MSQVGLQMNYHNEEVITSTTKPEIQWGRTSISQKLKNKNKTNPLIK